MHADTVHETIAAYLCAIDFDAFLSDAHPYLAMAYREEGRAEAVITAYRASLAIDPSATEP
jgi:hypothetical protein